MSDVFTKENRSDVMSRIKGKGNKGTEMAMIQILRKHHLSGWRRNQVVLGKPDFVFAKQRIALFVDGCFWHVCPEHSNIPKNNRLFWKKKLDGNRIRDKYVTLCLKKMNWKVIRVWEHELKNHQKVANKIRKHYAK